MNINLKKKLDRRTLLKGFGTVVALPLLDAMIPAFARAAATKSPSRMAFVYFPNGVQMDTWAPKVTSQTSALPVILPRTLEPLSACREDVVVLGGITVNGGRELGDGSGDHGRAGASYLTGAHPKKTFGKDLQAGISIDQFVAQKIGQQTRFASLELGSEEGIQGGNCDNGYSCAYSNSISWRTPSTPNPPEVSPRAVFERLFGSADAEQDPLRRARLQQYDKSVLDSVVEDANSLTGALGFNDRRKLDEYLTSIRDIERRIQKVESEKAVIPTMAAPASSVPDDFREHTHLMFDLITAAWQTDSTRIASYLMAIEQSNRAYQEIGIADSHHGLTHHGGDKEKIEKCIQINRFQLEQFVYFIQKLKNTPDGDGTLFDHSMLTYGSGLGSAHEHHNIPTVLAGRGNGLFQLGGRYIRYPDETPLANLHVSMAAQMGVPIEHFADSNGKLDYLTTA